MAQQKTKIRLLDVARQVFARQGYENTTMNDIAQASGKGRRTLYTYFENKETLYFSVISAEMDRLSTRMNEVASSSMGVEDKLIEIIYTHLELIKEAVQRNGNLRAEFFRNVFLVSKARRNFDSNEIVILTRLIEEGIASGIFDVESVPLTVDILHYSVRGMEIPYIYGRLAGDLAGNVRKSIVHKLVHKALRKE